MTDTARRATVETVGTRTMNGPLLPGWNESAPQTKQSKTINDVEAQDPVSVQTGGPAETFGQQPITPAAIENQWAIAAQPGLKIGITQRWTFNLQRLY